MRAEVLIRLNELRMLRKAAVIVTDLGADTAMLIAEGDDVTEDLREAVELALRKGVSSQREIAGRKLFINAYLPPVKIVVVGAVHISQALAPMAKLAGFDLSIIDPRTAFATPERFPETELIPAWPEDVLSLDSYTALAALTHVPDIDDFPLTEALKTGCFYVGALGSRKSHAARLERLRKKGVPEQALSRIRAPIGLDIGAASPAEIAVSILAEIVQALRQRDVAHGKGSGP